MLQKTKNLPHSRVELTIIGTADQFQHAFKHQLQEAGKTVKIPGFRPGKAPAAKVLEQVGRPRIETLALDNLISDAYFHALTEAKITPVAHPEIDISEYKAPAETDPAETPVVTFVAKVDIVPEVKVDGYKKIKLKKHSEPKVEQDEYTRVVEYLRKQQAMIKETDEKATLKQGMWVELAYEGSVDGVKRTDMANQHHPMVLGEGQLIPGFEEQLVGMKKGEIKTIKVKFPKDYHAKNLASKEAEFVVTISDLKDMILPEIDDEFAKAFGHNKIKQLEDAIRKDLVKEKEEQSRQSQEQEVIDGLVKIAKLEIPLSLVEQELERLYKEAQDRLTQMNFNWDTYLEQTGKSIEQIREEMRPQAEKNVRVGLALGKVVQEEGLGEGEDAAQQALDKLLEYATK